MLNPFSRSTGEGFQQCYLCDLRRPVLDPTRLESEGLTGITELCNCLEQLLRIHNRDINEIL